MSKTFILSSDTPTYYKYEDQNIILIPQDGFSFNGTSSTKLYIIGKKKLKINLAPLMNYIPSAGAQILLYSSTPPSNRSHAMYIAN